MENSSFVIAVVFPWLFVGPVPGMWAVGIFFCVYQVDLLYRAVALFLCI